MITSQEDYEIALERLASFLEHPPSPDSPDEQTFEQLLSAIDHYLPAAESQQLQRSGARQEAEALVSRASDLIEARKRRAQGGPYSTYPDDGRGIGPTTGA